jgi:DNA excision repair protein ERCC-2
VEIASPELAASARALAGSLPSVMELCDEVSREAGKAVGVSRERPRILEAPLEDFALAAGGLLSDPSWMPADEDLLGALFDLLFFRKVLAWFDSRYATVVEAEASGLRLRLLCMDPAAKLDERLGFARAAVLFSATLAPLDYHAAVLGGGAGAVTLALSSPFPRENLCVLVDRSVSTRYRDRPATLSRVAAVVAAVTRSRAGSYLAFLPSYEYLRRVRAAFQEAAPGLALIEQCPGMSDAARREFLERLAAHGRGEGSGPAESLVGFAVMGGLFGEAVDLPGEGLIGVIVIGPGLPPPEPERELIRSYFDEQSGQGFAYAYLYPGIGRVLQAAGRVIRSETDRGVAVLVDERFSAPPYRELLPAAWEPLPLVRGAREVARALRDFWGRGTPRGSA